MNLLTAFFVLHPSRIEELKRLHRADQRKPYSVIKTVSLSEIDYGNLISDLRVYREYIAENASVCEVDDDGVWRCILVRQAGKPEGVLVMPDSGGLLKWAAYISG